MRSAFCAWMTVTSGRMAGIAASRSPVKGHSMNFTVVVFGQVGAQHSRAACRRADATLRPRRPPAMPACACSSISSGPRPAVLHRVAQAMQRSHAGIAAPGKLQLRGAAGADQLIVNQVRRHADQRQVAPPCRMISWPAAKGIRCVKPSSAMTSPSWTNSWIASWRERIVANKYHVTAIAFRRQCTL